MKRSRWIQSLFLIALFGPLLAGCAAPAQAGIAQSDLERISDPAVPPADLDELSAGNRAFGLDFYQAVRSQPGNLLYSPISLSMALAMTYAGARAETAAQMANTLHFNLPAERLHPAFNALNQALQSQEPAAQKDKDAPQPFQLNIANSLWGQEGFTFQTEFLDMLAQNYGAGLRLLDFEAAPEPARQTINGWVSDNTQKKIQDLIPPGEITSDTRLVLANAIYFKGDWVHPFSKEKTADQPFNLLDGGQATVKMMAMEWSENLAYASGPGFQAVALPYAGGDISLLLLVPDAGSFADFEAGLDAARLEKIGSSLTLTPVVLKLPKFRFETFFDLAGVLSGMGMPAAFDPNLADFSGMTGNRDLYIGDVFHKASIAVDEKGTEAAAATAVIGRLTSSLSGPEQVELTVDRPFFFAIRDNASGTVLFFGRVLNPAG